jgi:hypothetical protein
MPYTLMLQRFLDGSNEVNEVNESAKESAGVIKFIDFLTEIGMSSQSSILELAQVLKVPFSQLRSCNLIEGTAQENIRHYVRNCRISESSIEFLRRQNGEAGERNSPPLDDNPENQKDNCG